MQIEKQATPASCFSALHPDMASAVHERPAPVATSGNSPDPPPSVGVTSPNLYATPSTRLDSAVHFDCTLTLQAICGLAEHRVNARPTGLVSGAAIF